MINFQPRAVQIPSLLWRPRPQDQNDFVRFGPDEDGFEALIASEVMQEIRFAMEQARPEECFGLLVGRAARDRDGQYVMVTGVVTAEADEMQASSGHVRVPALGQSKLRRRSVERYPIAEPIGWYHSHPEFAAFFSTEDRREQSTWPESYHVGLVISGKRPEGGWGVYRGPGCSPLQPDDKTSRRLQDLGLREQPGRGIPARSFVVSPEIRPFPMRLMVALWLTTLLLIVAGFGLMRWETERLRGAITSAANSGQDVQAIPTVAFRATAILAPTPSSQSSAVPTHPLLTPDPANASDCIGGDYPTDSP